MNIKSLSNSWRYNKPKNYSRKIFICSCQCPIMTFIDEKYSLLKNVMVKYEIEPNKNLKYSKISKISKWSTKQYWGQFKQVIEIPSIFDKLNDDDFVIKTSYFTRDDVEIPFIAENIKFRKI